MKNNRYTFDGNKQKLQTPGIRREGLRSYTISIAEVITSGIGSVVSPIPRLITCASGYFSRCAALLLEIYFQEIIRTKIGLPKSMFITRIMKHVPFVGWVRTRGGEATKRGR
jgi:hypothetical protein